MGEILRKGDKMPLANDIRPKNLSEFIGQKHIVGENGPIRRMVENKRLTNLILYGPPGTGKTTLAEILANELSYPFYKVNASTAGINDIRAIIDASNSKGESKFMLFVDEIHLFKKNIQQFLLDYVERGQILLVGSTAENPQFTIHKAILSRCNTFELKPLSVEDIVFGLRRGFDILCKDIEGYTINVDENIFKSIAQISNGDMRCAINKLELVFYTVIDYNSETLNFLPENISDDTLKRVMKYDSDGDDHFDTLSAFMKSLRGSDADAAIHYLARLIVGGDLQGICRRLLCSASEDIGLANPQAVGVVKSCVDSALQLGFPEARIPLAEATIYLATSPKSNTAISAIDAALGDISKMDIGEIPAHLRDAHYLAAKSMGRGVEYKYPHEYPKGWVEQQYMPDTLLGKQYYQYGDNKIEQTAKRYWDEIKN